jgi:hypothetical protein
MFRPKWYVSLTAVDALIDFPALQGDVIVHKTPHKPIVACKAPTKQGLMAGETVPLSEQ